MFLVKSSTKVYLGCDPLPGCQWFSSGVYSRKRVFPYWKMYENPGGLILASGKFKGDHIQSLHCYHQPLGLVTRLVAICCFSLPQEIAECAGGPVET